MASQYDVAQRFLGMLDTGGRFTFQTFDPDKNRNDRSLGATMHGTFDDHAQRLDDLNMRGAAVCVGVHQTDEQGHANDNVVRLRAVFVDLDGAALGPVLELPVDEQPHIIVESSPGRWHCYWIVEDMPLDEDAYRELQETLAKMFDGDRSVTDLKRDMRIPGFLNNKPGKDGERVKLITVGDHEPYAYERMVGMFPPEDDPLDGNGIDVEQAKKLIAAKWPDRGAAGTNNWYMWLSGALAHSEKKEDLDPKVSNEIEDYLVAQNHIDESDRHLLEDARRKLASGKGRIPSWPTLVKNAYGQDGVDEIRRLLGLSPRKKTIGGPTPAGAIVMEEGQLPLVVDKAQAALITAGAEIYARGRELVHLSRWKTKVNENVQRADGAVFIIPVMKHWLVEQMCKAAPWGVLNRDGSFSPKDPYHKYAETLMARIGAWDFSELRGVIETPTIDDCGRVVQQPGFDEDTSLYVAIDPSAFPPVPDAPTREDAMAALEKIEHPLRGFPFVDANGRPKKDDEIQHEVSPSRSVVLSAILSGLRRPFMRSCPLHAFTAPTAGTGKSLLAELVGIVVTGHTPHSMAQGKSPEEDEKRLSMVLREGDPVILIDNCEEPVGGDFLCSMLTQEIVQTRVLGKSERMILPTCALVMTTGNNTIFQGDVTRRVVVCRLDSGEERPDERVFNFDVHEEVLLNRGEIVSAALTALRAFMISPERQEVEKKLAVVGSFEDWTVIRGTLVWCGRADPAVTRNDVAADDPVKDDLWRFLKNWYLLFGDERASVDEVAAKLFRYTKEFDDNDAAKPNSNEVAAAYQMIRHLTGGKPWNNRAVGSKLRSSRDRPVGSYKLLRVGSATHAKRWYVEYSGQGDFDDLDDEVPF